MEPSPGEYQQSFARHRMTFGDLLSPEVSESLHRASLACVDNEKKEVGIIDFLCGLYLRDPNALTPHLQGDFGGVLDRALPIHRFGGEGLMPKAAVEKAAEGQGCEFIVSLPRYTDELIRLLWKSARLANALGKKASVQDVIAALTLENGWMKELTESNLSLTHSLADFDREVRSLIFYATPHTGPDWPTKMEFTFDGTLRPPFILELTTPSGRFQPVRSARVKLNGTEVASIVWPGKPLASATVGLMSTNTIEFDLDGPQFGSVEGSVRGTLP